MPFQYEKIRGWTGLSNRRDARDIGNGLSKAQNISLDVGGKIRTIGGLAAHGEVPTQTAIIVPGEGLFTYNTDHKSGSAAKDTGENWLALADAPNAQVDLYNLTDDSFTSGVLDFGTVTSYAPGAGKIDFPTTSTITDSDSSFITTGKIKAGDIILISGCSTTTANNITIVVEKEEEGTLTIRGTPLTVQATEAGTVTLTVLSRANFDFIDEKLYASDGSFGALIASALYIYVNRVYFAGAGDQSFTLDNWYNTLGQALGLLNDINISAAYPGAGTVVNIEASTTADSGDWLGGTYQIAGSAISHDGEEGRIIAPTADNTFAVVDGDKVTFTARVVPANWGAAYSGFRIYTRINNSNDPWTLMIDGDIRQGCRASLLSSFSAWTKNAAAEVYSGGFDSLSLSIDTYEAINSVSAQEPSLSISLAGTGYMTSVVANRRRFIANVRRYNESYSAITHQICK